MSIPQELSHMRISFNDIKSATDNFADQNFLGEGGFGRVYKGQLSSSTASSDPYITVAVKRLGTRGRQGKHEFLMEISTLVKYKHDNLVSLHGFCEEGEEKILVYKHEANGSLDKYLASIDLKWERRLRICLGAARGLKYLHSGVRDGVRVIHRDIKSSNILLDANWEAKISDFGLSKIGPCNQIFTFLVTNGCGTHGYFDPLYIKTGILTKESDVYSFGIVLFEILCGRLALIQGYENKRTFLSEWVKCNQKKGALHKIVMPGLLAQMEPTSFQVFSDIAFQCLNKDRKLRPTMPEIVKSLKLALKHQLEARTTFSEPQSGPRTKLWGSMTGGSPFLFQLEPNQKLKKITIFHDLWIHSFIFTAEDSDGLLHDSEEYGGRHYHRQWEKKSEMDLDADEEIIGISGSFGNHWGVELITSLSFETNKKKCGPWGQERNTIEPISGSWELGSFDGFYGRCDWYVDAIGCCLKT